MSEPNEPGPSNPYDLGAPDAAAPAVPSPSIDALVSMDSRPDTDLVPADVLLDPAGRIDEDISCRVCGYNLRGVDPVGTCPECGTAVGWSLVGDRLKFADPDWVRRLSTGFMWLIVSVFTGIAFGCVERQLSQLAYDDPLGMAFAAAVSLVGPFIALVGYWQITTPEPVERFGEMDVARVVARWANVSPPLLGAMVVPLMLSDSEMMMIVAMVVEILGGLIGLVGAFAAFTYVRRLALRIPDDGLATQTRIVMWGYAGALVFAVVLGLAVLAIVVGGHDDGMAIIAIPGCLALLLFLTFGIWAIVLMFLYRSRLEAASREARVTWARRQIGA